MFYSVKQGMGDYRTHGFLEIGIKLIALSSKRYCGKDFSMKNIDAMIAGHICLDITPKFPENLAGKKLTDFFIPGKLDNVGESVISTGGAVSNTGISCLKLGVRTALMAKVSADMYGTEIINIVKKYGADTSGMQVARGEQSSCTVVISVPGIDRIFLHNPGTNDTFGYNDINFNIVKTAKLFHLGYPTLMKKLYVNEGAELLKIYKKVKSLGVITSMDMTLPDPASESGKINWNKILKKVLPYVDIFLPSIEEILYMVDNKKYWKLRNSSKRGDIISVFSGDDLTAISDILINYGVKIIVIKCSERGLYVKTSNAPVISGAVKWQDRELWAPTYRASKILSAAGAGDSAIAGFLVAFIKGESIVNSLKIANAVGWQNLRAYDAVSGVGTWKETIDMIRDKKVPFNELDTKSADWSCIENEQIFERK